MPRSEAANSFPHEDAESSGSWHSIQSSDIGFPTGQPNGWPAQPEATTADEPPLPSHPVSQTPAAPQPHQPPSLQQQGFQNLQMQMQQMNQIRTSGQGQMKPDAQMSFSNALIQLVSALDRELEIVAKAGSDAFAQKDLARADAALKFSGRLTDFRQTAQELLEYYKRK
jgi:hypothetical protein